MYQQEEEQRYNIIFLSKRDEEIGFYLLLEYDRCIHSKPVYGGLIYMLDYGSLSILKENGVRFRML